MVAILEASTMKTTTTTTKETLKQLRSWWREVWGMCGRCGRKPHNFERLATATALCSTCSWATLCESLERQR
jgi:hypothetical protein